MKYRVAISGSYGGLNLGDEAILEVILRELRASLDVDMIRADGVLSSQRTPDPGAAVGEWFSMVLS